MTRLDQGNPESDSNSLFPQDGYIPFKPSVRSPKPPSFSESERASLTANDSVSANTSHRGSGGGGVSLIGRRVPNQSKGLLPQDCSVPFDLSMSSPKPPYCSDSAHDSLTTSDSEITSTSHCDSGGRGVIPSGNRVPKQSGGFPL